MQQLFHLRQTRFSVFDIEIRNKEIIPILFLQNEISIRTEVKAYTITNFIADFGGYLGLLLGGSILCVLNISLLLWKDFHHFVMAHQNDSIKPCLFSVKTYM